MAALVRPAIMQRLEVEEIWEQGLGGREEAREDLGDKPEVFLIHPGAIDVGVEGGRVMEVVVLLMGVRVDAGALPEAEARRKRGGIDGVRKASESTA